ncbi:MAG: SDR family oxidoreductase [Actinomycetota bacterium]|nr:SDR family oxidoreductase [Actinomycetota bacterium]
MSASASSPSQDPIASLAADANIGRIALITGGGTGIGRATALAFARTGASVAICGRRTEPIEAAHAEIEATGAACVAVSDCDIREPEQVDRLVAEVLERFGRIDVLVNNAGGQFTAPAEEIALKGFRAVQRLTVDAAWGLTQKVAVAAMIPARRGLVVFIGFSPRRGIPGFTHASAARAALENLAQGLANEWSRFGIRSVCVAPGNIDTEAFAAYGEEEVDVARRQVPLKRLGTPEEVGAVIAFLATEAAAFITGSSLLVDGGLDAWGLGEEPPDLVV